MKKFTFILFVIAALLGACAPQATAAPEATLTFTPTPPPTETPIPMPTFHPQFAALQEQIAASGGRFTLNPDGTISDGAEPLPGLTVSPDGTMTLTVDGETMTLDPTKAVFDDENGFSYPGYEQDADGNWVESGKSVVVDGVKMTLGAPDANGWSEVTDTQVTGEMSGDEAADKLEVFDPGHVGFAPDEAKLVYNEDGQKLQIVNPEGDSIAVWNHGAKEMVWDYDKMFVDGENVLFRIAKTWEMKGINPVDLDQALLDSAKLEAYSDIVSKEKYNGRRHYGAACFFYNSNRTHAIGSILITNTRLPTSGNIWTDGYQDVVGYFVFLDQSGRGMVLKGKSIDCMPRVFR